MSNLVETRGVFPQTKNTAESGVLEERERRDPKTDDEEAEEGMKQTVV